MNSAPTLEPLTAARTEPRSRGRLALESLAIAVLVGAIYLALTSRDATLAGVFGDDGIYLALGKSIATGRGWHSIYLPGAPVHQKYPPGLPALLALLWRAGSTLPVVYAWATTLGAVALAGSAALLWWLGREMLDLSALAVAALAVLPLILDPALTYFGLVTSEPYFMLGWAATLALLHRARGGDERHEMVWCAAAGAALAATALVRTQAVAFIPAIAVALVVSRARPRAIAAWAVAALLPVVLWALYHHHLVAAGPLTTQPDERAYLTAFAGQPVLALPAVVEHTVLHNASDYVRIVADYLSAWRPLGVLALLVLMALAVAGAIAAWRRAPALVLTVAANVLVVLSWPFLQDRLVLAMAPFLGLLAAAGVHALIVRLPESARRVPRVLLAVAAALVIVHQLSLRADAVAALPRGAPPARFTPTFYARQTQRFMDAMSDWVRANAAPDDRVLVSRHAGLFLQTGRAAVPADLSEPRDAPSVFDVPGRYLSWRIAQDGVTLVVLSSLDTPLARDIAELQHRCPKALALAGRVGAGDVPLVFRVDPADRCVLRTAAELTASGSRAQGTRVSTVPSPRSSARTAPLVPIRKLTS